MKLAGKIQLTCLTLLVAASCKTTNTPAQDQGSSDEEIRWLFVQSSASGSFDGTSLTLDQVPPTLMFSDRPNRVTGHMTTSHLLDAWAEGDNSFAEDPPNAVLSIFGDSKEPTLATIELVGKPTMDGERLTYSIRVLEGSIPATFGSSSLFIDHWRRGPRIGGLVVAGVIGHSIARSSEPKTVVVTQPNYYYVSEPAYVPPAPKSTTQKLQDLKTMYDKEVITKSDYDKKKAELLAEM